MMLAEIALQKNKVQQPQLHVHVTICSKDRDPYIRCGSVGATQTHYCLQQQSTDNLTRFLQEHSSSSRSTALRYPPSASSLHLAVWRQVLLAVLHQRCHQLLHLHGNRQKRKQMQCVRPVAISVLRPLLLTNTTAVARHQLDMPGDKAENGCVTIAAAHM
jgi:hypothetical protein